MSGKPAVESSVLCLGRTYCDLIFTGLEGLPALGRELFATNLTVVPGGGAFITATHLASLGRCVQLVTRVGTDPVSVALEEALDSSGIGLEFVERASDAGPQMTVAIALEGDRAFLSHRAGHGRPASLPEALMAPGVRHVHVAEYATLLENPGIIQQAKERGLTVSLDPSWDETLIYGSDFLQKCHGVDVFLPNLEEGRALARSENLETILSYLSGHFPLIVLKIGAEGGVLARGGDRISLAAPRVPVVDTTGAGDAFNAGFLHCWLEGRDDQSSLVAAIEVGSLSVQYAGGAARPRDALQSVDYSVF
ncbi:carbohydrate kinase family protein [Microvirga puerhi]|uniref:Sugar kinase n=1 Tax=Microvirga puerhi TaxID=2876078 RepID=A0ABS7VTT1_9HYPH|nr:sugar kinase [Microvirga puerhi]MBZ6078556.1 sugar kinase [Microvirga puerhi]